MQVHERVLPSGAGLATLGSGAIVVAALYFGRELLVPLVLASLLAFVLAPMVRLLRRLRIAEVPAVLVAVVLGFAMVLGLGLVVIRQVVQLVDRLPDYRLAIEGKLASVQASAWLGQAKDLLRQLGMGAAGDGGGPPVAAPPLRGGEGDALEIARNLAGSLLSPIATMGLVFVFVIFVLMFREDLRDRLIRLAGSRDLHRTTLALNDAADRLSRFFLAQVALNGGFGVFIAGGLWLIGLPNPVLWGILAGMMRFVPFVGTFIAVVPPVLLALAVDPGWGLALWVLALFAVSEPLMGQVFEPLLYGHSTGLSPLSVILAATFWAFLWGPIGLLLATPLTVCLVVLGRHMPQLEFLDVMLGDRPALRAEESFYQRALEGDADGLLETARRHLAEARLDLHHDDVALPGLGLAAADWTAEILSADRMERIKAAVTTLLDDIEDGAGEGARTVDQTDALSVACIAARGIFDEQGAGLAAQILRRHGFNAVALPNAAVEMANIVQLDPTRIAICCIAAIDDGSSAASIRHILRRLRRQLPDARLVIGLWRARSDSATLATLRVEERGELILTSIGEVVAFCESQRLAARRDPLPRSA